MTAKQLLHDPDLISTLSDEDLKALFEPYFTVTRPDESKRVLTTRSMSAKVGITKKKKIEDMDRKLKELGL